VPPFVLYIDAVEKVEMKLPVVISSEPLVSCIVEVSDVLVTSGDVMT